MNIFLAAKRYLVQFWNLLKFPVSFCRQKTNKKLQKDESLERLIINSNGRVSLNYQNKKIKEEIRSHITHVSKLT